MKTLCLLLALTCASWAEMRAQQPCRLYLKDGQTAVYDTNLVDSLTVDVHRENGGLTTSTLQVWTADTVHLYVVSEIDSLDFAVKPDVEQPVAEHVDATFALVKCAFSNVPKGAVCGVVCSGGDSPVEQLVSVSADGACRLVLNGLIAGTTYDCQPFVRWEDRTVTGKSLRFTTPDAQRVSEADLWVDLGLSVKWARYNLGASAPEEFGVYFAWGETTPKTAYTAENCLTEQLEVDDIAGNADYDAAAANWGNGVRLPRVAEIRELSEQCTAVWTEVNGVSGQLMTSKINGNTLFLPAAGYRGDTSLFLQGAGGYYWSSASYQDGHAADMDVTPLFFGSDWSCRSYGHCIRPVKE